MSCKPRDPIISYALAAPERAHALALILIMLEDMLWVQSSNHSIGEFPYHTRHTSST